MNLNSAHLHLLVNHIPITGNLIGLLVLGYGIFRKSKSVINAAYWLFVLLAVSAIVAAQTGEGAEKLVMDAKLAGETIIERHVQASVIAEWVLVAVGLASLAALFINRLKMLKAMPIMILILALIASGLMAWTGLLGGEIMHKEIRPVTTAGNGLPEKESFKKDD